MRVEELVAKMRAVFTPQQVEVLTEFINFLNQLVKASDFAELKAVVQRLAERVDMLVIQMAELAEAQRRTDERIAELAEAQRRTDEKMAELAEAQRRTDERIAELAEAQRRTEDEMAKLRQVQEELARNQKEMQELLKNLVRSQEEMNKKLGGIDLTMGYTLENEAYRWLPAYLEKNYQIKVLTKFIRQEIGGKEINILAEGEKDGRKVLIVGEAKSRLAIGPERAKDVFEELEDKIRAVLEDMRDYTQEQVVPVIVTHFASKAFLEEARKQGYIVVQSFEW